MKLNEKISKLLPRYAWLPYIGLFLYNFLVFYGTRIYNTPMRHICMETALDRAIPFTESAIVIYILAYVQWIVCFALVMRDSRELCRRLTLSWLIAETVCLLCFSFLPTTMPRPEAYGNGIFAWLTRTIFALDTPDNLFPSIHCIFSWFCFRYTAKCGSVKKIYSFINLIFTLLVIASTLLLKQHVVADAISGVALAEICYHAAGIVCKKKNRAHDSERDGKID